MRMARGPLARGLALAGPPGQGLAGLAHPAGGGRRGSRCAGRHAGPHRHPVRPPARSGASRPRRCPVSRATTWCWPTPGPAGLAAAGGDPGHRRPARSWPRWPRPGRTTRSSWWPRPPAWAAMCWPRSGWRSSSEHLAILPGLGKTARHQRSVAIRVPAGPIRFYQVSIGSSGQVSAPRLLAVPALPDGTNLTGLALTPDGRKLAVASQPPQARPRPGDPGGHAGHGGSACLDLARRPADPGEHRRDRLGAVLGGGRQHTGLPAVGRRPLPGPAAGHHGARQQPGGQPGGAAADMGWQR